MIFKCEMSKTKGFLMDSDSILVNGIVWIGEVSSSEGHGFYITFTFYIYTM